MKLTTNSILILSGILAFTIMACFPMTLLAMPLLKPEQPASDDPVATLQVIVEQTVQAMTQNAPTQTPLPPTATPLPPMSTPVSPTDTPLPTPTAVSYCDWVAFVQDVTVPDGARASRLARPSQRPGD